MNSSLNINNFLTAFEPISLEQMDGVALMNRIDTKYAFKETMLADLLPALLQYYSVLEVNDIRVSPYESLYYDTKNFDLYHLHHNGKPNRFKIRMRKYVSTKRNFFEIKLKNSKGRTIKERAKQKEGDESIHPLAGAFLEKHTAYSTTDFEAKFWVNFSRITLVSKLFTERVTLDIDLTFKNKTTTTSLNGFVIAEVKEEMHNRSFFSLLMKQHLVRPDTMTKYCVGVATLYKTIKANNFKPQLRSIKKLIHDSTTNT